MEDVYARVKPGVSSYGEGFINDGERETNDERTVSPRAAGATLPDVLLPMMNDEQAPLPDCFVFERCRGVRG